VSEAPPTGRPAPAKPKPADKQPAAALPPALAAMIDEQHEREQSRAAVSLPAVILSGIRSRAIAAGIEVTISSDGRSVSATSHSTGTARP
jgi:hypothetical protein